MKRRSLAILALAVAVPVSAQMRAAFVTTSAHSIAAMPSATVVPALGFAASAVAPTLSDALMPSAALPAAAAAAQFEGRAVGAALPAETSAQGPFAAKASAVSGEGADSLFDGKTPRPDVPASAAPQSAPRTPEEFALHGRRLFQEIRDGEAGSSFRAESIPSDGDMRGRLERLPGNNPAREKYVVELFKLAGAKPEDVVLQDIGLGRHNIMVVKKGRTDRVIVVGGHHDKVREGMGVIDNGTGSTMVANLYQALRDQETDATIVFIAFGREEEGLLGSEAYLRALTPEQKSKIDAMVNLDTLGVNGTFSWKNNSTRALLDRVAQVATATHHDLTEAHLDGGDADSSSFRAAGIPAITLYGASEDVIFDIIHTDRDTMAAFDLGHYKNAYLLTLELLKSLDGKKLGPLSPEEI